MSEETEKQFTEEEINLLKKQRVNFMNNEMDALRAEEEYSKLRASISKSRFEETLYKIKLAEMTAPQKENKSEEK